ncbi:hypothetical protein [Lysinibacillus xylanilyticus]|uniref:hypothetical protein n=1 Tax=Lysinibacillus xylanilyticus TaxID=582475 RepID=UPI0038255A2B
MKLRFSFISGLILVTFLSFSSSALADSQIDSSSNVQKVQKFSTFQISDDVLIERALKGDLVNNDYTTVEVKENSEDDTQTIEITKMVSITTLDDGQEVTEYSKSTTIYANVSGPTGSSKNETVGDANVSLRVELSYPVLSL